MGEKMMIKKFVPAVFWSLLLVGIVVGLSVQARQGEFPPSGLATVYEAILVNDGESPLVLARLETQLPSDYAYVGLAAGSTVRREAEQAQERLIWDDSLVLLPGERVVLRFWLAPRSPDAAPPEIEITAWAADGTRRTTVAYPDVPLNPDPAPATMAVGTASANLAVVKRAERPELPPDAEPWVSYVITFTNNLTVPTTLDRITDTMATGFEFVGMAYGSDVTTSPLDPRHNPLIWQGPWSIAGNGSLRLRYWAKAVQEPGLYRNTVQASSGGSLIGPAEATMTVLGPDLSLGKSASPTTLTTGQLVTYSVTLINQGNYSGSIAIITDSLPAGFTFQGIAAGSAITDPPTVVGEDLVWRGPYTVSAASEIHLIYRVHSGGTGTKTNEVTARDTYGEIIGVASSQVSVAPAYVMLPALMRNFQTSPVPQLEETFDAGVPAAWTPFVNYPGLRSDFWFWSGGAGWGRYDFSPQVAGSLDYRGWGLSMYLDDGAEEWQNYRVETLLRTSRGAKHTLAGIWFRGTHELQTDQQGGKVTGYYLVIKPDDDHIWLGRIPHDNPRLQSIEWVQSALYSASIEDFAWYTLTVQVEGAHITAWLNGVKLIDWVDPTPWERGTVGLISYTHEGSQFDSIRVSGPE